ncbi:MAG: hypothetical protein N2Z21_04685 [Candidatus Sumerlaeaceae bacterium]|nr:hypothetical protein [Candidatus Sumerlaeaceae bacterium]
MMTIRRAGALSTNSLVFGAMGACLIFFGCGERKENSEVQRKIVRVTSTTTPRPEKGSTRRPTPSPTKGPEENIAPAPSPKTTTTPPQPAVAANATTKTPGPQPSPGNKATIVFVTAHTFDSISPNEDRNYRIEGRGLADCRVYLRRNGIETELIPTSRTDTKIEFAHLTLSFLTSGEYDLVLRDATGREIILARAAKVPHT